MIVGIGIDLVDSQRIRKLMGTHEARFVARYFTAHEASHVAQYQDIDQRALSLAKRFAAKEACAKALGTGFRDGLYMGDIEIQNDPLGKPVLTLTGGALEKAAQLIPTDQRMVLHVSLTCLLYTSPSPRDS